MISVPNIDWNSCAVAADVFDVWVSDEDVEDAVAEEVSFHVVNELFNRVFGNLEFEGHGGYYEL